MVKLSASVYQQLVDLGVEVLLGERLDVASFGEIPNDGLISFFFLILKNLMCHLPN
jgi:hypothetical protein